MSTKEKSKEQELASTLLEVKGRASELSGEVTRQSKLLGAAHDRIAKLEKLEEELKEMEVVIADLQRTNTRLERQVAEAQSLAASGEKAVLAGKQIAEGLALLKSL